MVRYGKTAISGSRDQTVKMWDVETGSCLASFTGEGAFGEGSLALSQMRILAGDSAGHFHLLALRLSPEGTGLTGSAEAAAQATRSVTPGRS